MVGFGVWLYEACFISFHFCKEECWISIPAPLQPYKANIWWCESSQVQNPWHHSYKWGMSHLRGSHFPTVVVKAKNLTCPASLAARPHPHGPNATRKMFLHKALRRQSKWATWGSQPRRTHVLEGVVMAESRLKAAAEAADRLWWCGWSEHRSGFLTSKPDSPALLGIWKMSLYTLITSISV